MTVDRKINKHDRQWFLQFVSYTIAESGDPDDLIRKPFDERMARSIRLLL
ncbi:hypothetical protein K239x_57260 [Planctomycetes bacterium K23_9]|uniref:Uncharacterized protein n=1 Tax=Stieleria marina TaxID=1930275 RepID=A0A517P2V9_9BACT|nr:hypothetical protein K239x_57260 [Planctomycetes bacterium K23_9]